MANNLINLREGAAKKQTENQPYLEELDPEEATPPLGPAGKGEANIIMSWTAIEAEGRERGPRWFSVLGGLALLFVIFGIFTENYFFSIFIVLAALILMFYIKRGPQEVEVLITSKGVQIGRSFLEFKDLKSFWILEKQDPPELSLETGRVMAPFLRVPLQGVGPEELKETLVRFLKEEEHKESASDQVARSLGF